MTATPGTATRLALALFMIVFGMSTRGSVPPAGADDDPRPRMRRVAKRYMDLIQETRRTRMRNRAALWESEGEFLYSVLLYTSAHAEQDHTKLKIRTHIETALGAKYGHPGIVGGMSFRRHETTKQEQLDYNEVWNNETVAGALSQKWVVRERVLKPVGGVSFLMPTQVSDWKITEDTRLMTFHFEESAEGGLRVVPPNLNIGKDPTREDRRSVTIPAAIMLHFGLLGPGALRLAWPL